MQYIAVFSVRNHTIQFRELMSKRGFECEIISTPRRISSVCGLSAKFSERGLTIARVICNNFSSFIGIYALSSESVSPNGRLIRKTLR